MCVKKKRKDVLHKPSLESQKSLINSQIKTNSKITSGKLKGSIHTVVQPNQERTSVVANYANEFTFPMKKGVNNLERIAARKGVIVNPEKVRFCGNLDDIAIKKKGVVRKEIEEMVEIQTPNTDDIQRIKRVCINEKACKLYEIHDEPTVEQVDSFSDLY